MLLRKKNWHRRVVVDFSKVVHFDSSRRKNDDRLEATFETRNIPSTKQILRKVILPCVPRSFCSKIWNSSACRCSHVPTIIFVLLSICSLASDVHTQEQASRYKNTLAIRRVGGGEPAIALYRELNEPVAR